MVGDVRIARGNKFQMTGAAERKEREPNLAPGCSGDYKVLV